jgi:hypothetical protein
MTVAEYYDQHHVKGRAVLTGTQDEPLTWLVANLHDGVGQRTFLLCSDHTEHVSRIPGDTELRGRKPVGVYGHERRPRGPRLHNHYGCSLESIRRMR